MIAVDTNVLVYAHRAEVKLHSAAVAELVELAEGDDLWALPVFCITEFLRVVTHRRVFNPPSTTTQAFDFVRGLIESPTCVVVGPESTYIEHLEAVVREADARGNLIFDAQIAALCKEHGIATILTHDHDFRRFEGLQVMLVGSETTP